MAAGGERWRTIVEDLARQEAAHAEAGGDLRYFGEKAHRRDAVAGRQYPEYKKVQKKRFDKHGANCRDPMFGDRAVELIKELQRDEWIPPYNVRDGVDAGERSAMASTLVVVRGWNSWRVAGSNGERSHCRDPHLAWPNNECHSVRLSLLKCA